MTSFRQIEANRRNALKSSGPKSLNGKRSSRANALRHGLTAETVIEGLEDIEDFGRSKPPSSPASRYTDAKPLYKRAPAIREKGPPILTEPNGIPAPATPLGDPEWARVGTGAGSRWAARK